MLFDAVSYSLGAIRPIRVAVVEEKPDYRVVAHFTYR